jgi:hypothetical protein
MTASSVVVKRFGANRKSDQAHENYTALPCIGNVKSECAALINATAVPSCSASGVTFLIFALLPSNQRLHLIIKLARSIRMINHQRIAGT